MAATRTLSDALDEDRRRDRRPFLLSVVPGRPPLRLTYSSSSILLKLQRWGASCLPITSQLEAARRNPILPSPTVCPAAAEATSPQRRPLRESEDAAVVAVEAAAVEGMQSNEQAITAISTVGEDGGEGVVKVLAKEASSLQVEDEYLWADKYRPDLLKQFICNKDVAEELYQLVTAQQWNHLIFEGSKAVGKRSMVLALIRDAFGPDNLKIKESTKRFELKGEIANHIDVKVKISDHHVEIDLADLRGYEKHVITTLLNESLPSPKSNCDSSNCRVVVVHDADKLSPDLQCYISWFLGKYAGFGKIIFCCSNASKLEAVKHLCKVVTLKPPSFDEIINVLGYIAEQESIDLPHHFSRRIAESSSNNLRQAIRSLEATWKANYPFTEDQDILTGWEAEISNIAKRIMEEPSPKQLYIIRGTIRKLIEHSVPPYFIFCHLVAELKRGTDEEFQNSIDGLAMKYNNVSMQLVRYFVAICQRSDCLLIHVVCASLYEQYEEQYKAEDKNLDHRVINIEGFATRIDDRWETIQCFIMIEEFTVRFMSFYKSLTAQNSGESSVP